MERTDWGYTYPQNYDHVVEQNVVEHVMEECTGLTVKFHVFKLNNKKLSNYLWA